MTNLIAAINTKNEERVIARCIAAVAPFVRGVLIHDSGSTDGTHGAAERACAAAGITLYWANVTWTNYGENRSALLSDARVVSCGEGHTWLLDADEQATGTLPETLDHDGYHIARMLGDHEVWGVRIFSNRKPWSYRGALHELPDCPGAVVAKLSKVWVTCGQDGMQGSEAVDLGATRARYARDAEHFRALCDADPEDTRSAYYLAQSLKDSGQHNEAFAAYMRRGMMAAGFPEERYQSLLMVARYLRGWQPARSVSEVVRAFQAAVECRPSRHEAMVELAGYLNEVAISEDARGFDPEHRALTAMSWAHRAWSLPPSGDLFLVHRPSYQWIPGYELARSSSLAGWHDVAQSMAQHLLATVPNIGETERATLERIARSCPTPAPAPSP